MANDRGGGRGPTPSKKSKGTLLSRLVRYANNRVIQARNRSGIFDRGHVNRVLNAQSDLQHFLAQRIAEQYAGGGGGGGGRRGVAVGSAGGGGRGWGGGGGGGGGWWSSYQKELERKRKAIEDLYNTQRRWLDSQRAEVLRALPGYRNEALRAMATVNAQNLAAAKQARSQIAADTKAAQTVLANALAALRGDLGAQSIDSRAIYGAGQMYLGDAAARQAAANNFNDRLNAIMALAYGDARNAANTVHQNAKAYTQLNYQRALAELMAERARVLMNL